MSSNSELGWLIAWYSARVDGDWEHQNGITIASLDNPGWSLRVDLDGTQLRERPLSEDRLETEDKWWRVWKDEEAHVFNGVADPGSLDILLQRFREWASA